MPTQTIHVIALFKAKPEKAGALKEFLSKFIEPTLKEMGCLKYVLHQNTSDPTDLAFIEEWSSHADLDRHLAAPHIQSALPHMGDFLVSPPDIRRYVVSH